MLRRCRAQPRARRQHNGESPHHRRRGDPRIYAAPRRGAPPRLGSTGRERDSDGRQRHRDDALRQRRDWPDDERDRRLRHRGGDRTRVMIAFGLPVGFGLALLLIWFVFRKGGYKRRPLDAPPGPDWRFTGERFLDPPSGETVEVWSCPRTGERAYVRARAS